MLCGFFIIVCHSSIIIISLQRISCLRGGGERRRLLSTIPPKSRTWVGWGKIYSPQQQQFSFVVSLLSSPQSGTATMSVDRKWTRVCLEKQLVVLSQPSSCRRHHSICFWCHNIYFSAVAAVVTVGGDECCCHCGLMLLQLLFWNFWS